MSRFDGLRRLLAVAGFVSLAALAASAATPAVLWFNGDRQQAQLFAVLSVLLWLKHAGNIRRLIAGTEGRIGR